MMYYRRDYGHDAEDVPISCYQNDEGQSLRRCLSLHLVSGRASQPLDQARLESERNVTDSPWPQLLNSSAQRCSEEFGPRTGQLLVRVERGMVVASPGATSSVEFAKGSLKFKLNLPSKIPKANRNLTPSHCAFSFRNKKTTAALSSSPRRIRQGIVATTRSWSPRSWTWGPWRREASGAQDGIGLLSSLGCLWRFYNYCHQ